MDHNLSAATAAHTRQGTKRPLRSKVGSIAAAVALAGSSFVIMQPSPSFAAGCTASPITDPVSIETSNLTEPGKPIMPWQTVRFDFNLSLTAGHCAGDTLTIFGPAETSGQAGKSYPLMDEAGNQVADMTVGSDGRTITIKLLKDDIRNLKGWLSQTVTDQISAGPGSLDFTANGQVVKVPVTAGDATCDAVCQVELANYSTKSGSVSGNDITAMVTTPSATEVNQYYTVTDNLGADQTFDCAAHPVGSYLGATEFEGRNEWGTAQKTGQYGAEIIACSDKSMTAQGWAPTVGRLIGVTFPIVAADNSTGPYLDDSKVTTAGADFGAHASIARLDGGGSGDGTNETPTTPPTTPPTEEPTTPTTPPTTPPTEEPTTPTTPTTPPTTPVPPVETPKPKPPVETPKPPVETPKPKPPVVKMVTRTFQLDKAMVRTTAAANKYAALDNDGVLKYREFSAKDWRHLCEKVEFIKVAVPANATKAQLIKAINAKSKIGDISTPTKLDKLPARKFVVQAWEMNPKATVKAPFGARKNLAQVYIGRSALTNR